MWSWHEEGITSHSILECSCLRFPTPLWGIHRFFSLSHPRGFLLSSETLTHLLRFMPGGSPLPEWACQALFPRGARLPVLPGHNVLQLG